MVESTIDIASQLQNALHLLTQVLLYPVIIVLFGLACYALFSLGSLAVEFFRERRYFQVVIPQFLRDIEETPVDEIPRAIEMSGLLSMQRDVLTSIFDNRDLPEEGLWALAKRLLLQEKERRNKVAARNDAISKLAPMIGLMGTLIPLGPGIVAFGRGDGTVMASAMMVAFDTTVAGLVVAVIMFIISRVRRRWYAAYAASLEAGTITLLERIGNMTPAERATKADSSARRARGRGGVSRASESTGAASAQPRSSAQPGAAGAQPRSSAQVRQTTQPGAAPQSAASAPSDKMGKHQSASARLSAVSSIDMRAQDRSQGGGSCE